MKYWGGIHIAGALAVLTGACTLPGEPDLFDAPGHRAFLGVEKDDPWCAYMADLRAHLDGQGARPLAETRAAALKEVRAEAAADHDGDPYWAMRKGLACEFVQSAEEEIAEFDWPAGVAFLELAKSAISAPRPENGIGPIVPVVDHLDGDDPESLEPIDFSNDGYCDELGTSELALAQLRGPTSESVGFPGSLQRAPDWFAHVQASYHRWAQEHLEGHQLQQGDVDFGGIPFHCQRHAAATFGAQEFSIKDNLIFLLAERDNPFEAGRLEVRDADGNVVILDEVLEAAQLGQAGTNAQNVEFYPEDLAASITLKAAVDRANNMPPPKIFVVYFDYNERSPVEGADTGTQALRSFLEGLDPADSIRIAISGHADCVGPRWYNKMLADDRIAALSDEVIKPALRVAGFTDGLLSDPKRVKLLNAGESAPAKRVEKGAKCQSLPEDRRVIVIVQ